MKRIIIIIVFLIAVIGIWYLFSLSSFDGRFDKKYSRGELTENFHSREKEFADVVSYFRQHIPENFQYYLWFGLSSKNRASITLRPMSGYVNNIIGGDDLKLNSLQIDSALKVLGWQKETVLQLQLKLAKTKCDWIKLSPDLKNRIELYPNQKGWGNFSYDVFSFPIIGDSLRSIFGSPLASDPFGQTVILSYSSAL